MFVLVLASSGLAIDTKVAGNYDSASAHTMLHQAYVVYALVSPMLISHPYLRGDRLCEIGPSP